ncbi:hypothetical protein RRF57_002442 [Xylaria bambusicola]|uniref:Uncharacterized protein n=1 Tax=Xylaria bambusicola TaxID=326684 RepID=A0AAN7UFA8_9PEZI
MAPPQLISSASETPASLPPSGNKGTAPSRRAKAPNEYSTNPNTVRARRRLSNLPPYQRAVERARQNDTKAVQVPWKRLAESPSFQAASQTDKERILEEVKKEVMDRRRGKRIDAESKIAVLNQQYGIENNISVPPAIVPTQAVGESVPRLFSLPRTLFSTDIAPSLITTSKETAAQNIAPPAPASTSASLSAHVSKTDQPTLVSLTNPLSNSHAQAISAAIDSLKEQHETEKRRHEAEKRRLRAEMQEMRGLIQNLTQRVDQLSIADRHAAPSLPPQQPQPQQTQMQQTFHIYPQQQQQQQQQADFAMPMPSNFTHNNAPEVFPAPVEQHNYHYHYPYPFHPDRNNGHDYGHQYPAIDNNANDPDNNTARNAVSFREAVFEVGAQERGV